MKVWNWTKHAITLISIVSLILGLVKLFSLDVEAENFGNNILSSTFFLFLFVLLAVYRIALIGRNKVDWIATILAAVVDVLLLVMLFMPQNIMALWKPTLAIYIVLIGYILLRRIHKEHWSGRLTQALLILSCGLLLYPLLIKTGSAVYYEVSGYLLFSTVIAGAANIFLVKS